MSLAQPAAATTAITAHVATETAPKRPAAIRDTSLDIDVLRALLRLARRQTPPTMAALVERVGADEPAVRRSLIALARNGLVQRTPAGLRLSLPGLAVAVAYAKRPSVAKPAASKPAAMPAPARRRAA